MKLIAEYLMLITGWMIRMGEPRDIMCPVCGEDMVITESKWGDERTELTYDEYFCENCKVFVEVPERE